MKIQNGRVASNAGWVVSLLIACVLMRPGLLMAAGTWTPVASPAPDKIGLMLLLSDGTIMCKGSSNAWCRLNPGGTGGYTNGYWTTDIPMMSHARDLFASDVVPDGRVFVAGGEHPNDTNTANAEIYDPVANAWTEIDPPVSLFDPTTNVFSDMISMVTPGGSVLMAPVRSIHRGGTLLYDPQSGMWSDGPILTNNDRNQDECGWAMLPDGSIVTVDQCTKSSQRYIPSLNQWIPDGALPVFIWNEVPQGSGGPGCEIGPALTLPNGNVFYAGGTSSNVLYAPSGSTSHGVWTAGPVTPNNLESADTAGAVMVNGKLLFMTATNCFNGGCDGPWHFFEYDYTVGATGSLTEVSSPTNGFSGKGLFIPFMLDLPDGKVLLSGNSTQLWVYVPDGAPLAAGKPAIDYITDNSDGSYYLVGTGLNGITEGANEGDDGQMASDYPIVRLTDGSGNVYYARTYNWSSTTIQTGSTIESTYFTVPASLPYGSYSLAVVANGLASDPFTFYGPVWVDFTYTGLFQFGTFALPFKTLALGISDVASGGTINIKPGTSTETFTNINKAMEIRAIGGSVTIGVGH
jgi:hypothetical protein